MAGDESRFLVSTLSTPTVIKTDTNGATSPIVEMQPDKAARGKALRQVIAAFIANLGTINTGLVFGFSAVVIPQLKAKDSLIPIDDTQESWVASLSSAGTPFGCLLSGYVMDRLGRKKTLIMIEIPLIIGWLLIAFASDITMIYIGRVLVGFGSGLVGAPCRVYTSEVTQPHLRGMLGAFASVGISLGVLFQYTVGSFVTWQVLSGVSTIIPLLALICMLFMPESPNYLVSKSKPEQAVKCLAKLRGSTVNVQREVDQMQLSVNKAKANSKKSSARDTLSALLSPATLKPFAILTIYFGMYQFSGVNTITFYAVEIFQETGTTMNKTTCTIMLGVVRLIFTIIACIAMRKYGRRTLTFISGIGCGVTMIGLGVYLYFLHQWKTADPPIEPSVTWFPVACIFIFTITCTLGFLVVPWVMIGELYPLKVRGTVGGMTTCMAHIFVFIVVKTYPFLAHALYQHGVFMMYGCISFLGTVFFYLYLPETKGKTLQEIEDYFSGRTSTLKTKKQQNFDTNLTKNKDQGLIVEKDKLLS
ncbi:facilitated trehalose transporter Tret1-2 homolog [Bradysia coprophila]|uniref:facilitated trehalose transporter Tret1-2 homolog n=1 Tax=Bradysia coprophila TaxID=38358 RepID=UPI00187DBC48|nr:facilitated trehalose transporter Tret1-2 homolog [Bradysia coprophila]